MLTAEKIAVYGDELYAALLAREPVAPLTEREPAIEIADGYRIQSRFVERCLAEGETIIGKKIGVTSKVVQDMLNVHQPNFGQLLSGIVRREDAPIALDDMIQPKAEAEVAFVLRGDLVGPASPPWT